MLTEKEVDTLVEGAQGIGCLLFAAAILGSCAGLGYVFGL